MLLSVSMTEEEDVNQELLEQLRQIDGAMPEKESLRVRILKAWKFLKLKSALGHVGLLVSLSIYCAVGGIVSICIYLNSALLLLMLLLFLENNQITNPKYV